jgi:hypothetical protein
MVTIVFVFPGGEVVEGATYATRAEARKMKAHYENPRFRSQHGRSEVRIVPAKEAA